MAGDPITVKTVDDIFNFDPSDEDPFTDNPITNTRDDKATLSPRAAKRKLDQDRENLGLGLDEEVKITKKRKSIVKLDEARLLSEPGIPRLRALARSGKIAKKLGFKGKGHEFSDVARLLNYYQLWLDGLYPRAKFADGLQLIEKVGHSKRMNVTRKEWVDEGKPGYIRDQLPTKYDAEQEEMGSKVAQQDDAEKDTAAPDQGNADNLFFRDSKRAEEDVGRAQPEDDELDALLAENEASMKQASKPLNEDSEGDDDLNALLAEQAAKTRPTAITNQVSTPIDDEDDLDALLAEQ
jgi:replication fork protection complex subunit Csm3/Swi3